MSFTRRDLIRYSLALGTPMAISTALQGCAFSSPRDELSSAEFTHGVASGDPLADGFVIWCRAVPSDGRGGRIAWELATDEQFENRLRSGTADTSAASDFTVKIDVQGLEAGRRYYYRFLSGNGVSATGRAQTLPTGQVQELRMAVFSCSNYPAGYFHAYREASKLPDVDVFLHLGDYIYEYGAGGYATERAAELGREFYPDNTGELYTLADYRRRYALYRTDEDLQALHARAAMIAVWDDHEVANDTWRRGAENHSNHEGEFEARRAAAIQAYFEWLPIRPLSADESDRIYRRFDFGDLVSLHMLDTRHVARDEPLTYAQFTSEDGRLDASALTAALGQDRSLLGKQQLDWLRQSLAGSNGQWQVLGQQVLLARMLLPVQLLSELFAKQDFNGATGLLAELVEDKRALLSGEDLADERHARLQQRLPYGFDAWDGYPVERERVYEIARQLDKEIVVLAGDTHNAWQSELRDASGHRIGVELATPAVSSPGMENYLNYDRQGAAQLAKALTVLIDELEYCQVHDRGFMELHFTRDALTSRWHFVDDVTAEVYAVTIEERRFPSATQA